jgi:hypothetical protein
MRVSRLPSYVPGHPDAEQYDATQRLDMVHLANVLSSLRGAAAATVASLMVHNRVMFPNIFLRFCAWIWRKRGRDERDYWVKTFTHPKIGERMTMGILRDAALWAMEGTDHETPGSYGGFSQREVNFIAGIVELTLKHTRRAA